MSADLDLAAIEALIALPDPSEHEIKLICHAVPALIARIRELEAENAKIDDLDEALRQRDREILGLRRDRGARDARKQVLIEQLVAIQRTSTRDFEMDRWQAEEWLLAYVGDDEIKAAYEAAAPA